MMQILETSPQQAWPEIKLLLTVDEACAALSIKRTLLYTFLSSGELGSVKVRGRRLIPVRALEAFVERLATLQKASDGTWREDEQTTKAASPDVRMGAGSPG